MTYLLPLYAEGEQKEWLQKEIKTQQFLFDEFLSGLPKDSYAKYFLKMRRLISDMPATAMNYPERLPLHEAEFAQINFNDDRLWNSGVLNALLEGYYQLMETYGSLDLVYENANKGTNIWINSLKNNPERQEKVAEFTFKFLESRSLFESAKYLALTMLSQGRTLNNQLSAMLEQYNKIAVGKTAPDIEMGKGKKLSQLPNSYKLIAFGKSDDLNSQKEFKSITQAYSGLKKNHDLEIIYISIDTDKSFYKEAPFPVLYGENGIDSQSAKDYHISSVPFMILLNKENKILVKIKSVDHLTAWLQAALNK